MNGLAEATLKVIQTIVHYIKVKVKEYQGPIPIVTEFMYRFNLFILCICFWFVASMCVHI